MAHVNYFIGLWFSLSVIGVYFFSVSELIIIIITEMTALKIQKSYFIVTDYLLLVPVVVLIVLILIWRKQKGLSPVSSFARSFKRFKIGHGALLLGHILIVISLLYFAWSISFAKEAAHVTVSAVCTGAALTLALPLYIIGIICIETIRNRKPT
jgi:hypothetical protein